MLAIWARMTKGIGGGRNVTTQDGVPNICTETDFRGCIPYLSYSACRVCSSTGSATLDAALVLSGLK